MKCLNKHILFCLAALLFCMHIQAQVNTPPPVPNLTKVEYYIDNDPGFGAATNVSIGIATSATDVQVNIDPATLTSGVHTFGIRSQDANGAWSIDNKWIFFKPNASTAPILNITKVEYYIDNDPGFGNATNYQVSAAQNLTDLLITIDPSTLTSGVHTFGIRSQDANGAWSIDNKWIFFKPNASTAPIPNINKVEYYVDNDPGFGNAINYPVSAAQNLADLLININPATLTSGTHTFGIRSQDANGAWSLDNKWDFVIPVVTNKKYVNDNSLTTDVFTTAVGNDANAGTPSSPFATITKALSVANEGDTIYVDAGTYTEQVTTDKGITIIGAGQNLTSILKPAVTVAPPGSFTEQGVIQTAQSIIGDVHISNLSVTGDYTVGVTPIIIQSGGSVKNCKLQNGNQGIFVRIDPIINIATKTFVVDGNTINAEYIAVNFAGTRLTATLSNNILAAFNPGSSTGVFAGLDFGTLAGLTVTGNSFSSFVSDGLRVNTNNGTISQNSFTGTGQKAINKIGGATINATCNWYGSADVNVVALKITPGVTFSPWLVNGADNSSNIGFQSVPGVCTGKSTRYYVNNNTSATRIFTTDVGNDANPGVASAPFATLSKAYQTAQPDDSIFMDAGTYNNIGGTVGKSLTILGTNYLISPNDATNALLPNAGRNAETIITNSAFTIGANNINFNGFSFSPGTLSQFLQTNTGNDFDNINISKNIFLINSGATVINITGKQQLPLVTLNYAVTDNRFIKQVSNTGTSISLTGVDGVQVLNNTFTVSADIANRTQTSISTGGYRMDNLFIRYNTAYRQNIVISGAASKKTVIDFNKAIECNRLAFASNSFADPSVLDITDNIVTDAKSNGSPVISYVKNNGTDISSPNICRIERNLITVNGTDLSSTSQALIAPTVDNLSLNTQVFIRDNKLKFYGDFSAHSSNTLSNAGVRYLGNSRQSIVERNDIEFSATNYGVQNKYGIFIYHIGLTSGTQFAFLNNKISGFPGSVVIQNQTTNNFGELPAGVTVNINNNSFTGDVMSINNGTSGETAQATCNWYGSAAAQDFNNKISPSTVNFIPWLTNGTDNNASTGFQPVDGACDGYPTVITLDGYSNVTCNGTANGAINITTSNGKAPFTYTWTKDGDANFISHNEDPTNLAPGTYHLSIVDGNGSNIYITSVGAAGPGTITVTITEPPLLTASATGSNNICFGNTTGTAIVTVSGGTSPYTYSWSNAATTQSISNLAAATYTVTVTDANGCTATSSYTVTQPALLAANATGTKVSCFNGSNGTAIVTVSGGTSPYTYSWSNAATTQSISNLSAATYNVTVTDAKGCTANSSYQVTQPTLLTVSMTGTTATCIGSASATPAGGTSPYTYLWTNGATTQSISSIPAGTYTVTVTDAKSCTVSGSFTITGGNAINPTVALTQVSCFGLSNGRITVTNAGGPAPHTYNINGSAFQSNNVFSNLSPGTYVIGVKAANGCSDFITRTITQPTILTVALDSLRKPCGGVSNGRIYITPNGGTGTKIYNWTGPSGFTSTLQDPNNVATGNYNVMVTDANGCTVSKNVILPEWPPVTVSEVITNVGCRNGLNGAINVTITGGTNSGFTYAWTGPNVFTATTEDISGLMAGTYRIAITDTSSGCTSQKLIVVTQPAAVLNLSTASTNVNGCASLSTITATGTGGTLPYQYKIDNGAYQSSGLFSGLNAASYTLLVKDANGCTNSKLVSITDNGSDEYETNNTKTQAKTIATGTPIFARIATAADVADWFKFTTVNAGNFTLMLTHISASFTFNIYPAGNNTTALVPTNTTATTKQYALAANTTYYIGVTGGSSYTCYNLSIAPSAAALFEQPLYVNTKNEQSPIEISRLPVVVSKLSAVTYPNPHQGNFTIQINSPQSGISTIQLVDAEGRIINAVNKMLLTGISNKFNFNNIHQSILFYKITIGKLITTGKIVRPN